MTAGRGGKAIRHIRKKRALCRVFLVLFAVMMLSCTVSAGEKDLASLAGKVSGGTWIRDARGLRYRKTNGKFIKDAWIQTGGKIYRIGPDQYAETGWFLYENGKYYADSTGSVSYKTWLTLNGKKYYFPASGACVMKQWCKIKQNYYYFDKNGRMLTNCFVGDYYVDASGVRLTSTWIQKDGRRYYLDSSGKRLKNVWLRKNGKYYYMLPDGAMAVNCQIGDYYVDENGVRVEKHETFKGRYIFVGDSRMVGMSRSVSRTDTAFIAEVSTGYSWLQSEAVPELEKLLKDVPDAKVILGHGVNDLANLSNYILCYKDLITKHPRADFYILSVNPINRKKAHLSGYDRVTNKDILKFNQSMQAAFGSRYIDTYTYLKENGFETNDGIHYQAPTYRKLFNYLIAQIG